jgi:hypothetical protein
VGQAGDGSKVAHLTSHGFRRPYAPQQREVIDQKPSGRRVIVHEDALLPRHPRGNPCADLIFGDAWSGFRNALSVVFGLE